MQTSSANRTETLRTSADPDVRAEAIERLGLLFAEDVPNTWTGPVPLPVPRTG